MEKDIYYIAVKVFLANRGKFFICKDNFNHWDLPGGRLLPCEFNTPLEKVIRRKMREELGPAAKYTLGKPVVFMRHERKEKMPGGRKKARIFAVGYKATYKGGNIKLSKRHTEGLWVPIRNFDAKKYFTGGWLKGVQEYLELNK